MAGHVDTRWFKDRMVEKKISQRKLATILSVDPSAVSLMLRGKRDIKLEEAIELARILGLPKDDVLAHVGLDLSTIHPAGGTVKVTGWIDGNEIIHPGPVQGPRHAPVPPGVPDGTVALRYQTSGACDGWLVYYKPVDYVQPEAMGRYSVVQMADGTLRVRNLKHGYEPGTYRLARLSDKEGEGESGQVTAASPVLWLRQ